MLLGIDQAMYNILRHVFFILLRYKIRMNFYLQYVPHLNFNWNKICCQILISDAQFSLNLSVLKISPCFKLPFYLTVQNQSENCNSQFHWLNLNSDF
jgi:hypothetical protein